MILADGTTKHIDEFDPASALLFFVDLAPAEDGGHRRHLPPAVVRTLQDPSMFPRLSRKAEQHAVNVVLEKRRLSDAE